MVRLLSVFVVALFVAQMGCDSDSTLLRDDTYAYTAYNDADEQVVSGFLNLEFDNGGEDDLWYNIYGRWDFSDVGDGGEEPCHWTGEGELEGGVDATTFEEGSIDLNPNVTDNNLVLNGRFEDNRFIGNWDVITFAGSICSGRFEAVAQ